MKDFYQILGVEPNASQDQIRTAYRKLAVQWHPDKNKTTEAEEKFKEINQANDTLSDQQKRQQYDQQRNFSSQSDAGGFPGGFSYRGNFGGDGIHDIFENIFRQHASGGGFGPFGQHRPQRNPDTQIQIIITLEEAFTGKIIPVQFTDSSGKPINITVNVSPGIENGTRLRYAGNGSRTHANLPPGDLYVIIGVEPHAKFQRDGSHLITKISVNLWESLTGTEKLVNTIDGGSVKITIPPLSRDQTALRIKEKGMPTRADRKARGDLLVQLHVIMPSTLTDEQLALMQSWAIQV